VEKKPTRAERAILSLAAELLDGLVTDEIKTAMSKPDSAFPEGSDA
jgi:hypothetical protein